MSKMAPGLSLGLWEGHVTEARVFCAGGGDGAEAELRAPLVCDRHPNTERTRR